MLRCWTFWLQDLEKYRLDVMSDTKREKNDTTLILEYFRFYEKINMIKTACCLWALQVCMCVCACTSIRGEESPNSGWIWTIVVNRPMNRSESHVPRIAKTFKCYAALSLVSYLTFPLLRKVTKKHKGVTRYFLHHFWNLLALHLHKYEISVQRYVCAFFVHVQACRRASAHVQWQWRNMFCCLSCQLASPLFSGDDALISK